MSQTVKRRQFRPGVDAGHEHYKWWALSCMSLGMLLATINSGTSLVRAGVSLLRPRHVSAPNAVPAQAR